MDSSTLPSPQTVNIADRVLDEGAVLLVAAVRAAGLGMQSITTSTS